MNFAPNLGKAPVFAMIATPTARPADRWPTVPPRTPKKVDRAWGMGHATSVRGPDETVRGRMSTP